MNSIISTYEGFLSAKTLDDLWDELHNQLSHYHIHSVFYLVTHSPQQLMVDGAEESSYFKSSHTTEYRDYFDDKFTLEDDIEAMHCVKYTSPSIWNGNRRLVNATDRQKAFISESNNLMGLNVGVTIPLRFGLCGAGGIGLACEPSISKLTFEKIWRANAQRIISICYTYDEMARRQFPQQMVAALSSKESEVLLCLAQGKRLQAIAATLNVSEHTVATYLSRARAKLKARNNTQALIKAVEFTLIDV